jgi:class 3 adenylate cyclase
MEPSTAAIPTVRRARGRRIRAAAAALLAATLILTAVGAALVLATLAVPLPPGDFGFRGFTGFFAVSYGVVGWILASRVPRNRLGWLFAVAGLVTAVMVFAQGYTLFGLLAHPGGLPGGEWTAWLYGWLWVPFVSLAAVFGILLFPDGRVLSPRWRVVGWLGAAGGGAAAAVLAVQPGPLANFSMVANPAGIDAFTFPPFAVGVLLSALLGGVGGAALSLAVRLRRSTGIERQQLRWIAYTGLLVAVSLTLASVMAASASPVAKASQLLLVLAVSGVPIATGVAVLRYRLFDLDLLVNRTVVYGSVTAILALAFGVTDIGLQRALEAATGQRSDVLSGALGVGAALAFGPMRRGMRPLVDRILPSRAVLTLAFSDIVGSTDHLVQMGDERWRTLLERYHATVRQALARHGGREVNTAGDGFFAAFDHPADGLACAWELKASVHALGLETRTGLHLGPCEIRGEQLSGLAVHTAARVMSAAGAGEILVSQPLADAVAGSGAMLRDRGSRELKGVPGRWTLFALESPPRGR